MNRLVNILMIVIIVSCPIRCMMQGCGCYASASSCCSTMPANCNCDLAPVKCDCDSDGESQKTPGMPQKCQCKCFCSGVIVVDNFVLAEDETTQPLIQTIDTANLQATFRNSLESRFYPPDDLADRLSTNRGRQIRCQINSLLI